jgi:fibronectin type 3 domain-containing protein
VPEDGKTYYYKVTAVDKDGLESELPETPVSGSPLDKPLPPRIITAQVVDGRAELAWEPVDNRAVEYVVLRSHWEGLTKKEKKFVGLRDNHLTDTTVRPGVKYTYRVEEVDRFGIRSKPSVAAELFLPKLGD